MGMGSKKRFFSKALGIILRGFYFYYILMSIREE